jgi:hypothetical protein
MINAISIALHFSAEGNHQPPEIAAGPLLDRYEFAHLFAKLHSEPLLTSRRRSYLKLS